MAGFNWAYDLSKVKEAPINREQVAYAIHPYPQKLKKAPGGNLGKTMGLCGGYLSHYRHRDRLDARRAKGAHVPVINGGSYGPIISQYLEKRGISFTVWCFDPDWPPQMISDWNFTPTEQGKFLRTICSMPPNKTAKPIKQKINHLLKRVNFTANKKAPFGAFYWL